MTNSLGRTSSIHFITVLDFPACLCAPAADNQTILMWYWFLILCWYCQHCHYFNNLIQRLHHQTLRFKRQWLLSDCSQGHWSVKHRTDDTSSADCREVNLQRLKPLTSFFKLLSLLQTLLQLLITHSGKRLQKIHVTGTRSHSYRSYINFTLFPLSFSGTSGHPELHQRNIFNLARASNFLWTEIHLTQSIKTLQKQFLMDVASCES